MSDPAEVGRRVLEALAEGRRRAIAQVQNEARRRDLLRLVAAKLRRELDRGLPARGRAGRIARELHGLVTERHVLRILKSDALFSMSDSSRYNGHGPTDRGIEK